MLRRVTVEAPRPAPGDRDLAAAGIGLLASPTEAAQAAEKMLRRRYAWADTEDAQSLVALGGDGFMLQTLHHMLEGGVPKPVFGINRGTVGFLMNEWRLDRLPERIAAAKAVRVAPLDMEATTVGGKVHRHAAINEVSLLRETRQTATISPTATKTASNGSSIASALSTDAPISSAVATIGLPNPAVVPVDSARALTVVTCTAPAKPPPTSKDSSHPGTPGSPPIDVIITNVPAASDKGVAITSSR